MSTSFSEESVVAVIEIPSIAEYTGGIPAGYDLVEYEAGTDPYQEGMVLYGFDEVGMFELKEIYVGKSGKYSLRTDSKTIRIGNKYIVGKVKIERVSV
mgnify:CR=1 FL=1